MHKHCLPLLSHRLGVLVSHGEALAGLAALACPLTTNDPVWGAGKPLSKWLAGHHLSKAQEVQEDKAVFVVSVRPARLRGRWDSCC